MFSFENMDYEYVFYLSCNKSGICEDVLCTSTLVSLLHRSRILTEVFSGSFNENPLEDSFNGGNLKNDKEVNAIVVY